MHNWFFITINLYNFILCILNNFLKTYLKIITEGFTDGIYPSALAVAATVTDEFTNGYIRSVFHSPTTLPTDLIRRYLTVPATMTDECTDGYLRSIFQTLTDNFTDGMYPSVCHTITDEINSSVYFKRETFFCAHFPSVKPSANVFFLYCRPI